MQPDIDLLKREFLHCHSQNSGFIVNDAAKPRHRKGLEAWPSPDAKYNQAMPTERRRPVLRHDSYRNEWIRSLGCMHMNE